MCLFTYCVSIIIVYYIAVVYVVEINQRKGLNIKFGCLTKIYHCFS